MGYTGTTLAGTITNVTQTTLKTMLKQIASAIRFRHFNPISPGRIAYGAILILFTVFALSPWHMAIEQSTGLPLLFSWRGERVPPQDISIIALNSTASENLQLNRNSSQWPRTVYAQLLKKLDKAGIRMLVLDIAFREEREPHADQQLATAMAELRSPLILFTYLKRQQLPNGLGNVDLLEKIPPPSLFAQHADAMGAFTLPKYPARVSQAELILNIAGEFEAAQPLHAYMIDNKLYSQRLYRALNNQQGLQNISNDSRNNNHTHSNNAVIHALFKPAEHNANVIKHLNHQHLQDKQFYQYLTTLRTAQHAYINFYGYNRTITTFDIDDVLSQTAEQLTANFENQVIYVGYSEHIQSEQRDDHRTVYSDKDGLDLSGVEISATTFANLQEGSLIQAAPRVWQVLIILSAIILALSIAFYLAFKWSALIQSLLLIGYIQFAVYLFSQHYLWLPVISVALAIFLGNIIAIVYRAQSESLRALNIEQALEHYVPKEMVPKLSRTIINLESQKQLVHGVCMMTDIKGYTRLSENTPPQELHSLMNRYYETLIKEVEQRGGTIANIVGDSLLALWTGPDITPELVQKACHTAFAIADKINMNEEFRTQLPTCFALHGGQFSLGNLGARGHLEYSPVGDIINTISRIEPINRTLNTQMLCSSIIAEHVKRLCSDDIIHLRSVGEFPMRNKAAPFPLYVLTANQQKPSDTANEDRDTKNSYKANRNAFEKPQEELECLFTEGLRLYQTGQLTAAKQLFTRILTVAPDDGPTRYYIDAITNASEEGGNNKNR